MKHEQAYKRDNLLVKYIQQHKGKNNLVSSKQIAEYLNDNGYKTRAAILHTLITKIAYDRCLPICSINVKGYYWATDTEDIKAAIAELQNKIAGLQKHIDHLKNFIIER